MSATKPLIDVIAGARPNFMKIAPILHAIKARQAAGSALRVRLVHTGQHYDERMSGDFFRQLGIPDPDVNLEVGSGTQAEQTAAIMVQAPDKRDAMAGGALATVAVKRASGPVDQRTP